MNTTNVKKDMVRIIKELLNFKDGVYFKDNLNNVYKFNTTNEYVNFKKGMKSRSKRKFL